MTASTPVPTPMTVADLRVLVDMMTRSDVVDVMLSPSMRAEWYRAVVASTYTDRITAHDHDDDLLAAMIDVATTPDEQCDVCDVCNLEPATAWIGPNVHACAGCRSHRPPFTGPRWWVSTTTEALTEAANVMREEVARRGRLVRALQRDDVIARAKANAARCRAEAIADREGVVR